MVRTARFDAEAFVSAATALVAAGGPDAATLTAIAARVGAPTGSVYHRFPSRAAILAAAWLKAHAAFSARICPLLEQGAGRAAALALVGWARAEPEAAALLLLHDTESVLADAPPPAQLQAVRDEQQALDRSFSTYMSLVAPTAAVDPAAVARARFRLFDGPIALLRPTLGRPGGVPPYVDDLVAELFAAEFEKVAA